MSMKIHLFSLLCLIKITATSQLLPIFLQICALKCLFKNSFSLQRWISGVIYSTVSLHSRYKSAFRICSVSDNLIPLVVCDRALFLDYDDKSFYLSLHLSIFYIFYLCLLSIFYLSSAPYISSSNFSTMYECFPYPHQLFFKSPRMVSITLLLQWSLASSSTFNFRVHCNQLIFICFQLA